MCLLIRWSWHESEEENWLVLYVLVKRNALKKPPPEQLYEVPAPFQNACFALSGPQSFWPGGPQSFSQQSVKDTGCAQPPYHNQTLIFLCVIVGRCILWFFLALSGLSQVMHSPDMHWSAYTLSNLYGKGLDETHLLSLNGSCSCPGAVQEKLSGVGFIFNWCSYQGEVCVFQGYLTLSHHVMNRLHDGGSGEPQQLSF